MNVILHERFCRKVQQALDANGWSQRELSRRMGISPQAISQYMNGARCPGLDVVEKFAKALELPDPGMLTDNAEIHQAVA